jgi:actin-related protein
MAAEPADSDDELTRLASELDMADCDVVVIDCGAEYTRVGFSGEDEPAIEVRTVVARANAPTRVGRVQLAPTAADDGPADGLLVGEAALAKRSVLELIRPIARGLVTDWDALEAVWRHCFAAIGARPSHSPVLLTEAPLSPRAQREELVRRCFEAFGVPAVYVGAQPVLAAFAAGHTTALVVDVGASLCSVTPIYEGFVIAHAMQTLSLGGAQLSEYLARLLTEKGHYFHTAEQLEVVSDMKKALAYVARDPELEWLRFGGKQQVPPAAGGQPAALPRRRAAETPPSSRPGSAFAAPRALSVRYELPDGAEVELTSERFRCAEALFEPALLGREEGGLADCCLAALEQAGVDVRRDLCAHVVLSGGGSLTAGLGERLEAELAAAVAASVAVRVHAAAGRQLLAWQGGALLSSLPDFQAMWISRADYEISGAAVVHAKCVAARATGCA